MLNQFKKMLKMVLRDLEETREKQSNVLISSCWASVLTACFSPSAICILFVGLLPLLLGAGCMQLGDVAPAAACWACGVHSNHVLIGPWALKITSLSIFWKTYKEPSLLGSIFIFIFNFLLQLFYFLRGTPGLFQMHMNSFDLDWSQHNWTSFLKEHNGTSLIAN